MTGDRNWIWQRVSEAQIAIMTLTRLPAGTISDPPPGIATSSWAFPLVGAAIGTASAAAYLLAVSANLPGPAAALISLGIAALITGALHEDGLADFADGVGGGQDRERKLAIMRDSHIGTYGVVTLLLSIGLRATCIAAFTDPATAACTLVAVAIASRANIVAALCVLPPARTDGLGSIAAGVTPTQGIFASVTALAAVALLLPGVWPIIVIAMLATGAGIAWIAWRHLGGQTGDVLGCIQQCAEVAGLAAAVSLLS